jgi:hypothetical protein
MLGVVALSQDYFENIRHSPVTPHSTFAPYTFATTPEQAAHYHILMSCKYGTPFLAALTETK